MAGKPARDRALLAGQAGDAGQIEEQDEIGLIAELLQRVPLPLVFDDFEQNLTRDGRAFADPGFAETFEGLCTKAGVGKVPLTCRYPISDGPGRAEVPDDPAALTEGGRGLALVTACAAAWGHYPVTGPGGKVVWARPPLPEGYRLPEPAGPGAPASDAASAPEPWYGPPAAAGSGGPVPPVVAGDADPVAAQLGGAPAAPRVGRQEQQAAGGSFALPDGTG